MSLEERSRTEAEIARRIGRHNLIQIACCLVLVPGAYWAWQLSFQLPRAFCAYLLEWFGFQPEPISTLVAWAFLVLLAIEGVRRGITELHRDHLDLSDIDETSLEYCTLGAAAGRTGFAGGLGLQAHHLVNVLLLAPLCVLKLIQCYRSILRVAPATVAKAAEALDRLAADRRWIPVLQLGSSPRALRLLDRLKLIWTEIQGGETSVRIAPGKLDDE